MGWLEDLVGLDDLAEGLGFGDLAGLGLDDLEGLGGLERLTGLAFFLGRHNYFESNTNASNCPPCKAGLDQSHLD